MKKTEQSFNSTLKMGNCELKRQRISPVSDKRKAQNQEYNRIKDLLIDLAQGKSELTGLKATTQPLVIHHIDGRRGARLLDPFNMIVLKQSPEHEDETAHHSHERIQELLTKVRDIRLAQGFKYIQDGKSIYTGEKIH